MSRELNLNNLIEEIAPLNNEYRMGIREGASGTEILKIMWGVGNILVEAGVENIHPIAWKIYGRPGEKGRSNITRDFLSYCFRVRRFFDSPEEIEKQLPSLERYSSFREALPLLDNPKYQLSGRKRANLVKLLNSGEPPSKITSEIRKIKRAIVRIKNPRTQRLNEVKEESQLFLQAFNDLKSLLGFHSKERVRSLRSEVGEKGLTQLARLSLVLASEDFQKDIPQLSEFEEEKFKGSWKTLGKQLHKLVVSSREKRQRFRRWVAPRFLMEFSEMLNACRSDRNLEEFWQIHKPEKDITDELED